MPPDWCSLKRRVTSVVTPVYKCPLAQRTRYKYQRDADFMGVGFRGAGFNGTGFSASSVVATALVTGTSVSATSDSCCCKAPLSVLPRLTADSITCEWPTSPYLTDSRRRHILGLYLGIGDNGHSYRRGQLPYPHWITTPYHPSCTTYSVHRAV